SQGIAVGDLLQHQINLLESLSLNEILRNKTKLANALYPDDPGKVLSKIAANEAAWQDVVETDRLAQIILTNTAADELEVFRERFPAHQEIFLTDQYGALVAATNLVENYYFADQTWWQETYNDGRGRPFIGPPMFDAGSQTLILQMAVPVYAPDDTTIIGILHTTYDLTPLANLLDIASLEENDLFLDLLLPDGIIPVQFLLPGNDNAVTDTAVPLDKVTIEHLKTMVYEEIEIDGVGYLASVSPITTIDGNPLISELGWDIVTRQNRQTALTLVAAQRRTIIYISVLVMALSIISGLLAARYLTRPILNLTAAAQEVRDGNLNVQAPVESRDEIGELALTFNSMTRRLRDSITRLEQRRDQLEQRVADRTAELEQQTQMLDIILSTTTTYFFIFDRQEQCLYASPPALAAMGLTQDELHGKTLQDAPHSFPDHFHTDLQQLFHTGQTVHNTFLLTYKERDIYFEYAFNPVQNEAGDVVSVVATVRDITEQKLTQEALWHTQKMESLGILAGGVAHDFNNLLVAMLSQSSLALYKMPPDAPARKHVEKTIVAAERAADLTRQMLAYSGKGSFAMQSISLNELIRENVHLFTAVIPKNIQLNLNLTSDLPPFQGDPGQMQQIVMNLILNAAEAIGDNAGQITIATRRREITAVDGQYWQQTQESLSPGAYISLQIEDDGAGMDEDTLSRIFDPFFTTKFTGRGLGLAAVLGIVRGHKGGLRVTSQLEKGATFEILFPVIETASPAPAANGTPEQLPPPSAAVLVIDDEAPVREAVTDILAMENIRVYTAVDGQTGITLYQEHQQEINLVLLDLSMPGLSGHQTFQALRQMDEELKIILSSGYSEAEIDRQFSGENVADFLPKPFKLDTLVQTIQRHLI
ncbi:MAG TPA: response regulator, partial [Anaerolineae bacterium]|nr:response regulator [Anaerolineae bacterium]